MQEMKRLDIDSSKIWDPYQPMPTAMTKPRPWALSREQVELVQHGTKGLRPEWRDDFVDAVVDEHHDGGVTTAGNRRPPMQKPRVLPTCRTQLRLAAR
jgi:hypothetical protein